MWTGTILHKHLKLDFCKKYIPLYALKAIINISAFSLLNFNTKKHVIIIFLIAKRGRFWMVFWFSISWKAHYKNLRAFKSIIAQKLFSYRQEICCQTKFKNLLDKCALDRVHIKSTLKWSHSIIQLSIGKTL